MSEKERSPLVCWDPANTEGDHIYEDGACAFCGVQKAVVERRAEMLRSKSEKPGFFRGARIKKASI